MVSSTFLMFLAQVAFDICFIFFAYLGLSQLKKTIKQFMFEVLHEFEEHQKKDLLLSRAARIRQMTGW